MEYTQHRILYELEDREGNLPQRSTERASVFVLYYLVWMKERERALNTMAQSARFDRDRER